MTDTSDYFDLDTAPQVLLATVPHATLTEVVTPPDSCTGLRLVLPGGGGSLPTVTGVTSGAIYPCIRGQSVNSLVSPCSVWYVDISQRVDATVSVAIGSDPGGSWYVIADNASHMMATFGASDALSQVTTGLVTIVGGLETGGGNEALNVDSSGRIALQPATNTAGPGLVALVAGANHLFGPTAVGTVIKGLYLAVDLTTLTAPTQVQLIDSGSGQPLAGFGLAAVGFYDPPINIGAGGYAIQGQLEVEVGAGFTGVGTFYATAQW